MSVTNTTRIWGNKTDKAVSEWLYGDWDEKKLARFEMAYAVPGVHQYFDYLLDKRADNEYLRRYGMSYSDIHDPRKLRQTSSGSSLMSYGYHMVSRNAGNLYRDNSYRKYRSRKRRR